MAFNISFSYAKLVSIGLPGLDTAVVMYVLGYLEDNQPVYLSPYNGRSNRVIVPLVSGDPIPGPQDVANIIQQDIEAKYQGTVDQIEVNGQFFDMTQP